MRPCTVLTMVACSATVAGAQSVGQARIPVRALATPVAVSRDTFGVILNVRALPGGRLLVNDAKKHRLLMLDSALTVVRVVLDSIAGGSNSYGTRPEPIIPWLGDSTLFVDAPSRSLLVIAPDGALGRVMSAPDDRGFWAVAATSLGLDDRGRLLYRGLEYRRDGVTREGGMSVQLQGYGPPLSNVEFLPLIRADFSGRAVDTIAAVRNLSARRVSMSTGPNGDQVNTSFVNPLATGDEWALLSDGTIAIVRGHDYHVDWITSDGMLTTSAKLPFDWRRVTDDDKRRIRDSAVVAAAKADSVTAAQIRSITGGSGSTAAASSVSRSGGGGAEAGRPAAAMRRVTSVVPVEEFPDYFPPIRVGAARGDLDGNLWILPTTTAQSLAGELVYDVVNAKGELFERVRLPAGRSLVGFGRNGIVYLASGELSKGFVLERTRR